MWLNLPELLTDGIGLEWKTHLYKICLHVWMRYFVISCLYLRLCLVGMRENNKWFGKWGRREIFCVMLFEIKIIISWKIWSRYPNSFHLSFLSYQLTMNIFKGKKKKNNHECQNPPTKSSTHFLSLFSSIKYTLNRTFFRGGGRGFCNFEEGKKKSSSPAKPNLNFNIPS